MQILSQQYNPYFKSNNGFYKAANGNNIGTYTKLFRADLDWSKFTDYIVSHFKDKERIQIIQFASSDGSEAYSQIISLLEKHSDSIKNKFFPIEAFDIDKNMYKIASSGYLNISDFDKRKFQEQNIDLKKYFKESTYEGLKRINIQNDSLEKINAYRVSPILKNKVNFHHGDMFDILPRHEDDSNTILLCRNVLSYLTDREIEQFISTANWKLKPNSILAIGEIDISKADSILKDNNFENIMPCVYQKK